MSDLLGAVDGVVSTLAPSFTDYKRLIWVLKWVFWVLNISSEFPISYAQKGAHFSFASGMARSTSLFFANQVKCGRTRWCDVFLLVEP